MQIISHFSSRLSLRQWLLLDAATCAGMGLLLVTGASAVGQVTALPVPFLSYVGWLLLPLALMMAVFGIVTSIRYWGGFVVVAGNLLWVVASLILPLTGFVAPNAFGLALILGQALAVVILIALEIAALRRNPAMIPA